MEPFAAGTEPVRGEKVTLATGGRRLQPSRALADRSNQEKPTLTAAPADREAVAKHAAVPGSAAAACFALETRFERMVGSSQGGPRASGQPPIAQTLPLRPDLWANGAFIFSLAVSCGREVGAPSPPPLPFTPPAPVHLSTTRADCTKPAGMRHVETPLLPTLDSNSNTNTDPNPRRLLDGRDHRAAAVALSPHAVR